LILNTF